MSKFIRTKEGIIDTTKIATGSKYMDFATNDESFKEIFKTEPLAKADTIEELCDEFVYEKGCGKDTPMLSKNDFNSLKEWYMNSGFKVNTIYGAIWTDKGLIYVAKLNEKGELELIWK